MPTLDPPCQSAAYQFVHDQAKLARRGEAFQRLCMLLDAPSDMRCFLLVADRVRRMFGVVPSGWIVDEDLLGLKEVADWAIEDAAVLKQQLGGSIDPHQAAGQSHPMHGLLTRHPLYSMLCNSQQIIDYRKEFLLLQLQVLTARTRELHRQKKNNNRSYIELYELNTSNEDFAATLRQPHHACLAVRELSRDAAADLVRFMEPWQNPNSFASFLRAKENRPIGPAFTHRIEHICNYCELKSHARESYARSSGERLPTATQPCYGYVEYSQSRSGIDCDHYSPDDDFFDFTKHELIIDRVGEIDAALLSDDEPNEDASAELLLVRLLEVQHPTIPGQVFSKKASTFALDIDKECMPWSAAYLRPKEIEHTLLRALRSRANEAGTAEPDQLEICALVAVCLETGRRLEDAILLQYAKDPQGDLTLLPPSGSGQRLRWAWKGIQPLYKTHPPYVEGKEVRRCEYIVHAVHQVANSLLRKWIFTTAEAGPLLFNGSLPEYRKRIKDWLGSLDSTGRLTATRVTSLKWSLLSQLMGGGYAEVSLVLGLPHPRSRVPLFYALLDVADARRLFATATASLWGEVDEPMTDSIVADASNLVSGFYVGCRAFPLLEEVRKAIAITREAFERAVKGRYLKILGVPVTRESPPIRLHDPTLSRAVLFVVWHQCFAIAHRATVLPYIPVSAVNEISGLATLKDKTTSTGYRTRLVWLPPGLLQDMREVERYFTAGLCASVALLRADHGPIFFLEHLFADGYSLASVSGHTIEQVSRSFFAFPSNTPRRVMRYLLRRHGLSPERVDVFMGHLGERREPWAKWSSFDYGDYLGELRRIVPAILADLGFGESLR